LSLPPVGGYGCCGVAQGPIARKLLSLKSPSTLARIAGRIAIA
jgi:hypothetical protein